MRNLIAIFSLLSVLHANAQRTIDVDKIDRLPSAAFFAVGGEPFVNNKFVKLTEGSPYYADDWRKAIVILQNGTGYKDLMVKLDLYNNEVHYQDKSGNELIATTPIKDIIIENGGRDHHFIHSSFVTELKQAPVGWYELLVDEPIGLFKYYRKSLDEYKRYGSATYEQQINTSDIFYIVSNTGLANVKKAKEIPAKFPVKQKETSLFVSNLASVYSDEDKVIQTVMFLNKQSK